MEELLKKICETHSEGTKLLNELVIRMKEPMPVKPKASDAEIADFLVEWGLRVNWTKAHICAQSPKHNLKIDQDFALVLGELTNNYWLFDDHMLTVQRNARPDDTASENSNNQ